MILALQCCPHDSEQAVELTRLICDIEPEFRKDDVFCLSARRDTSPYDMHHIAQLAGQKFGEVWGILGTRMGTGWPAGPNELWSETMMRVSILCKKRKDHTGVLTFEPDCVPLRADWIDVLKAAWKDADARGNAVVGHAGGWPPDHINGNAIFRIGLLRQYQQLNGANRGSWDMCHGKLLLGIAEDVDAITQNYRWQNYSRGDLQALRKNGTIPALLHGVKGGDAIKFVREMLNDGTLEANSKTERGHYRILSAARERHPSRNVVIRPHDAGFFSMVNNVATCCEAYDNVLVDWRAPHVYSTDDKGNMWEYFFTRNPAKGQLDITRDSFEMQACYPDWGLTAQYVAEHYLNQGNGWRARYHQHWLEWGLRDEFIAKAEAFTDGVFGKEPYIAVQARASANHAKEQTSGKLQSLDEYAGAIRTALETTKRDLGVVPRVYVAASDTETLDYFKNEFNAATYPDTRRAANRSIDFHAVEPQTWRDAENCLTEVLIMSKAHVLIHPVSNMATAALYINPRVTSIYIP